ncbi:MAG: cytochrome b [Parvularculaceae bacterium]
MSSPRYSAPARWLHWLVALLVVLQIALGWIAEAEKDDARSLEILHAHVQLGVLILGLMLLRLTWRLARSAPAPPAGEPPHGRAIAAETHGALYLLLLTMPASGYVIWSFMNAPMSFLGVFALPDLWPVMPEDETSRAIAWYFHVYSSRALMALIALHVGAALYHELILRDRLIRERML